MHRFPWCPELGQLLGPQASHTSIQTRGRFPGVIGPDWEPQGDHQGAEGRDSGHPMPILLSLRTWAREASLQGPHMPEREGWHRAKCMGSGIDLDSSLGSNTHKQCSPGARSFETQFPQTATCFHTHFPTARHHTAARVILSGIPRPLKEQGPGHRPGALRDLSGSSPCAVLLDASLLFLEPGTAPPWGLCLRGTLFTQIPKGIPHLQVFVRM